MGLLLHYNHPLTDYTMKTNENPDGFYQKEIEDLSAKEDSRRDMEGLSEKDEALMYDNGPESPEERHSNEAVKGVAWLFGIVAVFAVAILLTWIVGHHSPVMDRSSERQAYALSHGQPSLKGQIANPAEKAGAQFMAILVPANSPKSSFATTNSSAKTSAADGVANKPAVSQTDYDRIEREAREVIHGDFGDNPGRKAKLGADYAAVQARVNQILH